MKVRVTAHRTQMKRTMTPTRRMPKMTAQDVRPYYLCVMRAPRMMRVRRMPVIVPKPMMVSKPVIVPKPVMVIPHAIPLIEHAAAGFARYKDNQVIEKRRR